MRDGHAKWSSCSLCRRSDGRKRGVRSVDGGRGRHKGGVTQPLLSLAEAPRGSFHPPDDDLTRTTEGSFPPSRFPNSSNFALMEYAGAKIYLSFCPIQKPKGAAIAFATRLGIMGTKWIRHGLEKLLPEFDRSSNMYPLLKRRQIRHAE